MLSGIFNNEIVDLPLKKVNFVTDVIDDSNNTFNSILF